VETKAQLKAKILANQKKRGVAAPAEASAGKTRGQKRPRDADESDAAAPAAKKARKAAPKKSAKGKAKAAIEEAEEGEEGEDE
jgi:hypothetical protein